MNSEQHEAKEEKNRSKELDWVYLLFIVQLSFSVCVEPPNTASQINTHKQISARL